MDLDQLAALGDAAMQVGPIMNRVGETPWSLAGRVLGLGKAEQAAGIPKWGWFTAGLLFGGTAIYFAAPHLPRRSGSNDK